MDCARHLRPFVARSLRVGRMGGVGVGRVGIGGVGVVAAAGGGDGSGQQRQQRQRSSGGGSASRPSRPSGRAPNSFQKKLTRSGRNLNDPFSQRSKTEGYVARSAYKLLEIQQKHAVIPPGGYVLDLGCHPGAWLQVACQAIGPRSKGGLVLGIDIQETTVPGRYTDDRVKVLHGDAREVDGTVWKSYAARGLDVVLSGASSGVVSGA